MSGPEPPRFPVRDEPADSGERREGSSDETGTPADATDAPTTTPAGDRGAKDSPESRPPPPTTPPAPSSRPLAVPPSQREGIGERRPAPERPSEPRPTPRGGEDRPASWRPTQSRPWEPRPDPSAGEARPGEDPPKDPPKDRPADGSRPGAAPASPPRSDFSVRRDLSSRPGLDPTPRELRPDPAAGEQRRDSGNLRPEPPTERPRPADRDAGPPRRPGATSGPTTTPAPRPDPFRRPGSGDRPGDGVTGAGTGTSPADAPARSGEASTGAPSTARPATDAPTTRPGERPSEREGTSSPGTDPTPFRTAWKPTERSLDRGGPATMPLPGTTDRPPARPEPTTATEAVREAVREKVAEPTTPERPLEREPEGTRAHVVTPVPPTGRMTRVAKIPVGAAFRIAVVFYLLVVVLWLIFGSVLFLLLQNTGVVENIESFYGELLGYENVQFQFSAAFLFSAVAGLVWVLLASIGSAFMAFVYNRASRLVGGLKVVVDDEDAPGH